MDKTLDVINSLEKDGTISRYAIGGAIGAMFYMEPIGTFDLDIFVEIPNSTGGLTILGPLYDALRKRGYAEKSEFVMIEGIAVQFIPAYNDLTKDALTAAREVKVGDVTTRVFRPEHLAAIMIQTGREKDRQRFAAFISQAELNQTYLAEILERFGLTEAYKRWNP